MRGSSLFLVLTLIVTGCGSKGAVSLTADIPEATLTVQQSLLASQLTGSFVLRLALGPEASGPTSVTLGNFSLQDEAGAAIVELLSVDKDVSFPLSIDKGASKSVNFTLTGDGVTRERVCPGPVRIVGSLMDTLKGGTDPVRSGLLMPTCVPAT